MQKYLHAIQGEPMFAATVGCVFIFSLLFGVMQGTRCKRQYAMQFWPGVFAIALFLDYLFICFAVVGNFPEFKHGAMLFFSAAILGGVIAAFLWLYNLKKLNLAAKAAGLLGKQVIASICVAPFVILLPLMIILSISGASESYRQASGKARRHHRRINPWKDD